MKRIARSNIIFIHPKSGFMAKKITPSASGSINLRKKISVSAKPKIVLKKTAFKFKIKPNPVIFKSQVSLSNQNKISIEVLRNPGQYTAIEPAKTKPGQEKTSDWNCSIQQFAGTVIRKEPVIHNPNFSELYPGAIFDYESIANGTYKRLPYLRKEMKLHIDRNHASIATVSVNDPSSGSVASAVSQIVGSIQGGGAAKTFGESFEVLSEEDLFMRTGGAGNYLGMGGEHQISFSSKERSHKFFVSIYQEYYSILVDDSYIEPSDYFVTTHEKPADPKALNPDLANPNWVIVSSVKYGRLLNLIFESNESFSEYGVDVKAYANFLVFGASMNLSVRQKSFMKRTSVTLMGIGGNPALSGQVLTAGNSAEVKKAINNYFSGTKDEVPIAYTLATLDGDNIGVRMMSDFTSRQCAPAAGKFKITWNNIVCKVNDDGSDGEEVKAMVRIRAWDGKGKELLDAEKKNAKILELDAVNRKSGLKMPLPWTFSRGNRKNPINLNTHDTKTIEQSVTFKVNKDDKSAKFGIRADILEFDDFGDDDFTDDLREFKFSEIIEPTQIEMICSHEASRIGFNFTISPVYDE